MEMDVGEDHLIKDKPRLSRFIIGTGGACMEWFSNGVFRTRECKLFRRVGEIDVSCVLVFIANEYEIGSVKLIDA